MSSPFRAPWKIPSIREHLWRLLPATGLALRAAGEAKDHQVATKAPGGALLSTVGCKPKSKMPGSMYADMQIHISYAEIHVYIYIYICTG